MKIGYLRRKGRGSKIVKDNVPIILDAPFKFFISKKLSAFFTALCIFVWITYNKIYDLYLGLNKEVMLVD